MEHIRCVCVKTAKLGGAEVSYFLERGAGQSKGNFRKHTGMLKNHEDNGSGDRLDAR